MQNLRTHHVHAICDELTGPDKALHQDWRKTHRFVLEIARGEGYCVGGSYCVCWFNLLFFFKSFYGVLIAWYNQHIIFYYPSCCFRYTKKTLDTLKFWSQPSRLLFYRSESISNIFRVITWIFSKKALLIFFISKICRPNWFYDISSISISTRVKTP